MQQFAHKMRVFPTQITEVVQMENASGLQFAKYTLYRNATIFKREPMYFSQQQFWYDASGSAITDTKAAFNNDSNERVTCKTSTYEYRPFRRQ